jgi:periplasmic divalent cation tolerance protein
LCPSASLARHDALERTLRGLHPYELPEILAVEAAAGLAGYLDRIGDSVTDPSAP